MHVPRPPSAPKSGGKVAINQRIEPRVSNYEPAPPPVPKGTKYTSVEIDDDDEEDKSGGLVEKFKKGVKKRLDVPKAHTRIIVCALAVALLWASSLIVCRLVVYSFLPRPSLDQVVNSVNDMQGVIDNEKQAYVNLVEDTTAQCTAAYESSNNAEIARWETLLLLNNLSLENSQGIVSDCSDLQDVLVFQTLLLSNRTTDPLSFIDPVYFDQGAGCTEIQELFERQIAARRAYDAVAANDAVAINTVTVMQQRLAARAAYDAEYLANITGLSGISVPSVNFPFGLPTLNVCLGADDSGTCASPSFLNLLDGMYGDFDGVYDGIQSAASGFISVAGGYANTVGDVISAVGDAASQVGALSSDFTGFTCCNLNAEPWTSTLNLGGLIGATNLDLDFPSSEELQAEIAARAAAFGALLQDSVDDLDGLNVNLTNAQIGFWSVFPEDYNPPSITEGLGLKVDGVAEDFADTLGFVSSGNITRQRDSFFDNANESAANFLQNLDPRDWELYAYGEEVFQAFTIGTDLFTSYALLFDAVYRILVSIMLIRKYWNISGIATPPADIRNDSFGIYKEKRSIAQTAAYILTHPLLNMFIIALWVIILALFGYFAYEPLYSEYVDGCVQNNALTIEQNLSDGTMIYRNVRTIADNFAFTEGDNRVSEGIDTLNLQREFGCRTDFDRSLEDRTKQNETFVELDRRQNEIIDLYNLLNTCVDWAQIDLDKSPPFPLAPIANTSACRNPLSTIDLSNDLLHDCTSVDECIFVFNDAATTSVNSASHAAACFSEFYLHAYLLSWTFAIAMYILLNIARLYFMRGVIAIWWRRITLGRFSYLQSCTQEGEQIPPKEVMLEEKAWSEVVVEKLKVSLKKFERAGYFELAYAIALQLPWIIGLSVLGPNLNFTP